MDAAEMEVFVKQTVAQVRAAAPHTAPRPHSPPHPKLRSHTATITELHKRLEVARADIEDEQEARAALQQRLDAVHSERGTARPTGLFETNFGRLLAQADRWSATQPGHRAADLPVVIPAREAAGLATLRQALGTAGAQADVWRETVDGLLAENAELREEVAGNAEAAGERAKVAARAAATARAREEIDAMKKQATFKKSL